MTPRRLVIGTAITLGLTGAALMGDAAWIQVKAAVAQVLLDRAFAETVAAGGMPVKPWGWADTWPVARIRVPRIDASAVALEGSSGQALAFGPGHVEETPVAGEPGTAVYAAHRDTHFAFLGQVRVGDRIDVTRADGLTFTYRVTGMEVVDFDKSGIDATAPGRNLVLATCWPLNALTHGPLRYVVHATMEPEPS
ncbi:MAG: class GN sortase [Rhizobiales bacterium]|nr:class GN sortase [Hyphomicrobiales bacterium]